MPESAHPAAKGAWALVPVKRYELAKSRLASCLSPAVRRAMADAMLSDVLDALCSAGCLEGLLVVTADEQAARVAHRANAQVLHDREESGTDAAVRQGIELLASRGAKTVLALSADVPLMRSSDVIRVVAALQSSPLVLVPDRHRSGTNLFGCRLPAPIPTCFGVDSFERHLQLAREARVAFTELDLPGLAVDLDEPEDLVHARELALAPQSRTAQLLSQLSLHRRYS